MFYTYTLQVQEQFHRSYHLKTNLEQTFIIGNRILLFLCQVLPTHEEYVHERYKDATCQIEEDIETIRSQLYDVALWLDLDIYYSDVNPTRSCATDSDCIQRNISTERSKTVDSLSEGNVRTQTSFKKVSFSNDIEAIRAKYSHVDAKNQSHRFSTSLSESYEGGADTNSKFLDLWLCRDPDLEIVNMSQESISSDGGSFNCSIDDSNEQRISLEFSCDASFPASNRVLKKTKCITTKLLPPKKEARVNPLREHRRRQLQLDRPSGKTYIQGAGTQHDKELDGSPTSLFDLDLKRISNDDIDLYGSTTDSYFCSDPFETFTTSIQVDSDFSFASPNHTVDFSQESMVNLSNSKQDLFGAIRSPQTKIYNNHDHDVRNFDFDVKKELPGDRHVFNEKRIVNRDYFKSASTVTSSIQAFEKESEQVASENCHEYGFDTFSLAFPDETENMDSKRADMNSDEEITTMTDSRDILEWHDDAIDISVSVDDGSIEEDTYSAESQFESSFHELDNSFMNERTVNITSRNSYSNESPAYEDQDSNDFIRSKMDPHSDDFSQSIDSSKLSRSTSSTVETEALTIDEDIGSCVNQRFPRRIKNVGYELDYLESKVQDLKIKQEYSGIRKSLPNVHDTGSNVTCQKESRMFDQESKSVFQETSFIANNNSDRNSPHDEIDELELTTSSIYSAKSESDTYHTSSTSYSKYALRSSRSLTSARIRAIKSTSAWKRRYGSDTN